jgi:hypothetical protein
MGAILIDLDDTLFDHTASSRHQPGAHRSGDRAATRFRSVYSHATGSQ